MARPPRRRQLIAAAAAAAALLLLTSAAPAFTRKGPWMIDGQGRVVVAHGFNIVRKAPPFARTEFTATDAQTLQSEGFTLARIGFIWEAVEPRPGVYDDAYIKRILDLDTVPDDVHPTDVSIVGNYALKIVWSDGHSTGLYTWEHLGNIARRHG